MSSSSPETSTKPCPIMYPIGISIPADLSQPVWHESLPSRSSNDCMSLLLSTQAEAV